MITNQDYCCCDFATHQMVSRKVMYWAQLFFCLCNIDPGVKNQIFYGMQIIHLFLSTTKTTEKVVINKLDVSEKISYWLHLRWRYLSTSQSSTSQQPPVCPEVCKTLMAHCATRSQLDKHRQYFTLETFNHSHEWYDWNGLNIFRYSFVFIRIF